MRIRFTQSTYQISPGDYEHHLARNDIPSKNGPPYLHAVHPAATPDLPGHYNDIDQSLKGPDGSFYFRSETFSVMEIDTLDYRKFTESLCQHFLGANTVADVAANPEMYRGLPFFDFILFNRYNLLYCPNRIENLFNDFYNVLSDGENKTYRTRFSEGNLPDIYQQLAELVALAHGRDGSFVLEMT